MFVFGVFFSCYATYILHSTLFFFAPHIYCVLVDNFGWKKWGPFLTTTHLCGFTSKNRHGKKMRIYEQGTKKKSGSQIKKNNHNFLLGNKINQKRYGFRYIFQPACTFFICSCECVKFYCFFSRFLFCSFCCCCCMCLCVGSALM